MNLIKIILIVSLILAIIALYLVNTVESFGSTSPGTMVQLSTSHVPTQEDVDYYTNVYPKVVRRDISDLTGEDPGPLRGWVFPPQGI